MSSQAKNVSGVVIVKALSSSCLSYFHNTSNKERSRSQTWETNPNLFVTYNFLILILLL